MAKIMEILKKDLEVHLGAKNLKSITLARLCAMAHYLKMIKFRGIFCNYSTKKISFCKFKYDDSLASFNGDLLSMSQLKAKLPNVLKYTPFNAAELFNRAYAPARLMGGYSIEDLLKGIKWHVGIQGYQVYLTMDESNAMMDDH